MGVTEESTVEQDQVNAKWVAAKYGPKTIGMGHAGGPAFLMIRPGQYQTIDDVADDVVRIRAALNAVRGIPTEALEAGVVGELVAALERCKTGNQNLAEFGILPPAYRDEAMKIAEELHAILRKARGATS